MNCCCKNVNAESIKEAKKFQNAGGIKVLGGGCKNCHTLMQNVIDALAELNRTDNVELVTDFSVIALYGVMSTPALVVNSKVVSVGKVLSKDEVKKILEK